MRVWAFVSEAVDTPCPTVETCRVTDDGARRDLEPGPRLPRAVEGSRRDHREHTYGGIDGMQPQTPSISGCAQQPRYMRWRDADVSADRGVNDVDN